MKSVHPPPRRLAMVCMALLCAGPAAAQLAPTLPASGPSTVTLNGYIDSFAGRYQLGGRKASEVVNSGGMSTSWWGLQGSEDLGDGLRANFWLWSFLRLDTGESGRFPGDGLFAKRAAVGLQGRFGDLTLGRWSTPLFLSVIQFNPFGDSALLAPVFTQLFVGNQPLNGPLATQETTANNAVTWLSPTVSGLRAVAQYSAGEVAGEGGQARLGANLGYVAGGFAAMVAVARDRLRATATPPQNGALANGIDSQSTWLAGVSHDFGPVKLYGQWLQSRQDSLAPAVTPDARWRVTQLGASAPVGAGKVLASWSRLTLDRSTGTDPRRDTAALGYDYSLSPRTGLYTVAMFDRLHGNSATTDGSGRSLVAGLRHRF